MLKCLVAGEDSVIKSKFSNESFALVGMATQSFMPDMQALSSVQQNSPIPQQQQSPQSSISTPNHSQANQVTHSQASSLDVRNQTAVTSSLAGNVSQGSQTAQKTQATIQGVSVSSALATAQVVVATHSSPISQPQQQTEAVVQATQSATPPQFIVAVSEHENPAEGSVTLQPNQTVHPTYVQYVDSAGEPNIYATNNGQMTGYSVYSVTDASAMYTPATAGYYTGGSATAYSQLIEESSGYKVQGQVIEADAHHNLAPVSAAVTLTNRISPVSEDPRKVADIISPFTNDQCVIQTLHSPHDATQLQLTSQQNQNQSQPTHHSQHQNVRDMDIIHVQWLIDNYETAEGVSLPRSTLYNHYLRHCSEHKLDPVNAASFGKLIRSVFLGLRTRRLGTRGNSKYHYYGIRVKPNSPLNQISEENAGMRQQTLNQIKNRFKANLPAKSESNDGSSASSTSGVASQTETPAQPPPVPQHQHQQFLGDASTAIPNFIDIDTCNFSLPDGITLEHLEAFKLLYREHCEAFLDAVVNLQFSMVDTLWQSFWRTYNGSVGRREQEKILSKTKFFQLCKHEPVLHFIRKSDYQFYQNLVDVLIPDVLRPIPSSLTQAIRNFAKCLEAWLSSAMTDCPDEVVKVKVSAVSAFAQTLRRYTSLNHLAQAARAVLQNSSQINQMMADLNRVDFHNVQEQASWVCQCDESTVQRLEQDFKLTLQQQNSLEQWAQWLEGVVDLVLQPYDGKPDFPKAARQFLLKWSFYSSMVIRDLTLRSAASFGSFHLIRLLYDEYMFYLIEHRVAKAINETPIAVMGEFIGLGAKMNSVSNDIVLNSKNISVCGTSKSIMENGTLNESNCTISQDMYSSNAAMTNGLKEAAALQASLIGQPQVRFMSSVVSEAGIGENISQHSKKLKAV